MGINKIVLDTNAYSNRLNGASEGLDIITESNIFYMSIFVLGELYAGFKGGNKEIYNKKNLNEFLHIPGVKILNATNETAAIQ